MNSYEGRNLGTGNLTANWIGHYEHDHMEFPITAELLQTGDRISGFMRDVEPDEEYILYDPASAIRNPREVKDQIDANLLALIPQAGSQPIHWVSHLPPDSILLGKQSGRTLSFIKTYQGISFQGYRIGDQYYFVEEIPGHSVEYEGQISLDGQRIQGKWWIESNLASGAPCIEGKFILLRS